MKTMTMIYYKPSPEHFDDFIAALKKISPDSYVLARDEEVIEVFIRNSIEELTDLQTEGLEWLDEYRFMLREYSPEEGHTRPMTAFIEQEPSFYETT